MKAASVMGLCGSGEVVAALDRLAEYVRNPLCHPSYID
jgi:hypothetical protein